MRNNEGELILVDFGLSLLIPETTSFKVLEESKEVKGFIGTPRYASIAAHNGISQTAKDDI